jgi:hypothetical protein
MRRSQSQARKLGLLMTVTQITSQGNARLRQELGRRPVGYRLTRLPREGRRRAADPVRRAQARLRPARRAVNPAEPGLAVDVVQVDPAERRLDQL